MRNLLVNVLACLILVTFDGPPVDAYPTPENADTDSNKTDVGDGKSPQPIMARKSVRPPMVPVYQTFVAPPNVPTMKYERFPMPFVPPRVPGYSVNVPVVNAPLVSGFQPAPQQILVQPMPLFQAAFSSPVPQRYLRSPVIRPAYNYVPYAPNTYASYTFRSAADDEDQSDAQFVQYNSKYVLQSEENENEEPATVYMNEYSSLPDAEEYSQGMEPREVLSTESDDDFASLSGTSDQYFYEDTSPYFGESSVVSHPEQQQPHFHQLTRRRIIDDPMSRPYTNLEGTTWIMSRDDDKVLYVLMT